MAFIQRLYLFQRNREQESYQNQLTVTVPLFISFVLQSTPTRENKVAGYSEVAPLLNRNGKRLTIHSQPYGKNDSKQTFRGSRFQ